MTARTTLKTVVIATLLASNVAAADFPKVFGEQLGKPLAQPECPKQTRDSGFVPWRNCWTREPYSRGDEQDFRLWADASFARNVEVVIKDDRIVAIEVLTTGIESQDDVLRAVSAKFGRPRRIVRERLQNRMGAKFVGVVASWSWPGAVISFDSTESDLDNGSLSFETEEQARAEAAKRKPPSL